MARATCSRRGVAGDAGDGQIPAHGRARFAPGRRIPPPDGNLIPSGTRNATLARLAGTMRRVGMSQEEILAALAQATEDRCRPPLPMREVEKIAASICRYEPDQVAVAVAENHWEQDQQPEPSTERGRPGAPRSGPASGRALARPGVRLRGHGPLPGDGSVPERW